MYLNWMLTAAG